MSEREHIEKIPKGDPCRECDGIKERNLHLEQNDLPLSVEIGSQGCSVLEKALKQAQGNYLKYKQLIDLAPDAIFVADAETGILLEANKKASELLGIPCNRITGMHQSQLHPAQDRERYRMLFQEHTQKKLSDCIEDVYMCNSNGDHIPVQIRTAVIHVDNRKIIFGIFRDMTEQKKLQQQLADGERRYRELYRNAQVALYRTRVNDGKMLDCSRAAALLLGYADEEELINLSSVTETYVAPEQRKQMLEALKTNKRIQGFQIQLKRKDGFPIWVSITAEIFPEQGFIEGMMADITITMALTNTEVIIIDLIMQGKSNKEIAYMTERSVRTIEDHRAHIMNKLGASNIVELTQIAMNHFNHGGRQ